HHDFFTNETTTTEIYTLSLHDALPICPESSVEPASWKMEIQMDQKKNDREEAEINVDLKPALGTTERQKRQFFASIVNDKQNHRSEEHTSELQSRSDLVCRLLLEKKKT